MRKVIRLTENDLVRLVKRVINEQGFDISAGNTFICDMVNNGLESKNQSVKINSVNGDKIYVSSLNPSSKENNIEAVKDLKSDPTGKTYTRTDKKGYVRLKSKQENTGYRKVVYK